MTPIRPSHFLDEVISVVHSKGGSGKSSLATNLAYALAVERYRVLVIDLDRQTGQNVGFGITELRRDRAGRVLDVGSVLRGEATLDDAVITSVHPGLDVLPADERSLAAAEADLAAAGIAGQVRLYELLDEAARSESDANAIVGTDANKSSGRWDVVIIDTPGRQTDIVGVALAASTGVLVPAVPEGGPVAELGTVLDRLARVRLDLTHLEVYGLVRMRVGGNSRYRRIAEDQTRVIADEFRVPLFRTKVPEDAKFGESHLAREPIGRYSPTARSAVAYRYIAEELITRRNWPRVPGAPGVALPSTSQTAAEHG